jgi:iron uptake system component EfeO
MKKTFTIGLLGTLALACFAYGCGDDEGDPPASPAGSAGNGNGAGNGNNAGNGNGAGNGNVGGSAGAPQAGSGGGAGADGTLTQAESEKLSADVHATVAANVTALKEASTALCNAAPTTVGPWLADGQAAVAQMKAEWVKTRLAYEQIEGVIAPIYPDTDAAIDERYDGFMESLAPEGGDKNLFDDQGVTGMHAIERILYSRESAAQAAFGVEAGLFLTAFQAGAFPVDDDQAKAFKEKLCQKLVVDTTDLETQWAGLRGADGKLNFDLDSAYTGLLGLVTEQEEKVRNASTQLDESRYSNRTMADLRANLEGVKAVYAFVSPLLAARPNADAARDGVALDTKIKAGLDALKAAYDQVAGDAIPDAPEGWPATEVPTDPALLDTPFGKLFVAVKNAVDPAVDGSVTFELDRAAKLLGIKVSSEG